MRICGRQDHFPPRIAAWLSLCLIVGLVPACGPGVAPGDLPPASQTLVEVGQRLGRLKSPGDLTEIARRGDRVLELLTASERMALGRSTLRFRVDRPTSVTIAASVRSIPFWLADQDFHATGETLRNADGDFALYQKTFAAGEVGLGVNALDRRSPAHYAVFLQGLDGSLPNLEGVEPPTTPTTGRGGNGSSPFLDVDRPFVGLPPSLVGSMVLSTRHDARADGALASGRVWKTHQPSTASPDQVVVSFGADPMRSLSITWRTDPTVKSSAVRIFPQGEPAQARTLTGDAHKIGSDGLLNDPTILRHRVLATGLEPDTSYAYAVGDGSAGGWSETFAVRTAPAKPGDFSFLYLGDAQCGLERWGDLLHAARKHRPDAGFLILAGDLVDRGNERTNWDHFFLRAAGVFEGIPFLPAVGNHEYLDKGPMIYQGTFDLPANGPPGIAPGLVYSFSYADALVAVLDSNLGIHDSDLARVQAEWLDQVLARSQATWKFVTFHHPVYASHVSRENPELAAAWGPVFDRHHVDLVLQGHDHAYLRTRPMLAGRVVASPAEGTVYVVSVSGEKFYDQNLREYTARGLTQVATYQTIDIQTARKRLTYRSFDRDGHEVDTLVIDKGAPGPSLAGPRR